ncbi:hypothetical protein KDK95_17450 [Actinospica sp. MGRD01-02]|uniref:Uncharacterized protein n=1 Tax=Actinospica acidithermotolerans TaxID=2828514 RepID=A0A941EBB0_9ACTN|nr:hypothetical protein [Actinospica acidithermotolerans]MBR7828107.1 hypothetical protein [Actinospica acidithermotolerans]
MSREWQQRVPNIDDGNVRWSVVNLHSVEFSNEFEQSAKRLRDEVRRDPAMRAKHEEAYRYLLENTPTVREWAESTDTSFCSRAQLHEYLQAFSDYVFGDRTAPIAPPDSDEPCEHEERDENGECVPFDAEDGER